MSTVEQELDPELGAEVVLDGPRPSRRPVAPLSDERLEHIRIFAELATRGMTPPSIDTVAELPATPTAPPTARPAPARPAGGARRRAVGAPRRAEPRRLGGARFV